MNEGIPQEPFDIEKSPFREAYHLLGAKDPLDLYKKYVEAEQPSFKDGTWDYDNPDQIQNKIKEVLETTNESGLSDSEREWVRQILWFWYHHAIIVADAKRDKEKMKEVSEMAMRYEDESNILTRAMYLLCHEKIEDAERWVETHVGGDDYQTAKEMIENYKKIGWLWLHE